MRFPSEKKDDKQSAPVRLVKKEIEDSSSDDKVKKRKKKDVSSSSEPPKRGNRKVRINFVRVKGTTDVETSEDLPVLTSSWEKEVVEVFEADAEGAFKAEAEANVEEEDFQNCNDARTDEEGEIEAAAEENGYEELALRRRILF